MSYYRLTSSGLPIIAVRFQIFKLWSMMSGRLIVKN